MAMNERVTSRRNLLRGQCSTSLVEKALRPPGAIDEALFLEACTRCGDCIKACPEQVIAKGDGGFPSLDFRLRGCIGCQACLESCPTVALSVNEQSMPAGIARIDESCLAQKGVTCQSCKDSCEPEAILFSWENKTPVPRIVVDQCTGCGECVSVCPSNSISVDPN
ncbi:ferredoxin-type protein NapF [Reinekea marina]|uniref:Ferredoxin-type protein NapF n=1 Tax=Reinekea marina TaxID=1310421 RepID=A0ABV7WT24_9GAMM|nr:ferredoxin-type protein NapF [Reinekea marina]MDN3648785.1 ferredoxin-type protein NapF [Reinekea marina]